MHQGKRKSKSIAGQPPDNPANNSKPINIPDFVLKREIKTLSSHARRPFQEIRSYNMSRIKGKTPSLKCW